MFAGLGCFVSSMITLLIFFPRSIVREAGYKPKVSSSVGQSPKSPPITPPLRAPQMFKPVRVVATIIFLLSIGLIFVGAFVIKIGVSAFSLLLLLLYTSARHVEAAADIFRLALRPTSRF